MSTPSWIRRLSESDETRGSTFELPQVSLYASGSRSNLSQVSQYRSSDNISETRRDSRDSNGSYGNVSNHYQSRTYDRRRCSEDSSYKFGTVNSGYTSEAGSSTIRSNPNSLADLESVASSKYTSASGSRSRLYTSREPREHERSRYSGTAARQGAPGRPNRESDREPNREDSWSYVDSEGYARLPVSL